MKGQVHKLNTLESIFKKLQKNMDQESTDREKTMLLWGFECDEDTAVAWARNELKKLGCAAPESVDVKGNFTNMLWVKFSSTVLRDDALKKIARPAFKHGTVKIWADKDFPYDVRQLITCLLGVRKDLISRGLDTAGIFVDKDGLQIFYYGDVILTLACVDNRMEYNFGTNWSDYCYHGTFEDLQKTCETRLTKGRGKGKSKPSQVQQ
jgi:hypothetical protein